MACARSRAAPVLLLAVAAACVLLAPSAAQAVPKAAPAAAKPAATAPPAGGKKAFKIGCLLPLTGGKSNTGKAIKAAMEMAVNDLGDRLPGVDIQLVCQDSQCGDVPALRAAATLARSDNVDAIVGDVCSAASLAATSVANKYQIPMVSPASTSTSLSTAGDYFLRTVPSDRYQGEFAAAQMLAAGVKRAVVAYSDESYGQGLSFSFIAAFTRDGGKAFPVPMPVGVKNATAVLAEIQKQKPDGLFIASNKPLQAGDLIKAVKDANLPFKVTIFGGDSTMDPTVAAAATKAYAVGMRGSDVSYGSPSFVADFKKFVAGRNISYVAKASHAYDAVQALIEAYRRADPPKEGPQILAALANVRFQGKSGPIAFDDYGDLKYDPVTSYSVSEFNANGDVVTHSA